MTTTAAGSSSPSPAARAALPVGFRFRPTDEELVRHYLKAKIAGRAHPDLLAIPDVDLAAVEPWDLPARSVIKSDDPEWFFFARRDRPKYPGKSSRSCRSTAAGYWKATGKDRLIRSPGPSGRGKGALIGVKKTLVFHRGRAPRGTRTPWIMHEYTATEPNLQSQSQSQSAGPQNDSFVLYRLFNKQDEETPGPISESLSTSPPGNPLLQQADDTASTSMVEDEASPSDSSQLTPTNATTDHSSTAHLLAAAGDAEQIADQEAAYMATLEQLSDIQFPTVSSPMHPYTDLPFVGNMGDEQHDFSMYLNNFIGEQDVQDMLLKPAHDETGASNPTGSWTPYPQDMLDIINSIGPMGAAPWTQQQPTAPVELVDPQQGIAARRIRLAYAVERASASQPILACHLESEGEGELGCSTESSSSNHEEDHVNDAVFQTMAGDLMHNIAPAQALVVSPVEVADKLQHLSFNDNSILEEEDAKPRRGASLKQGVKQDLGRNGHDQDGLLRNSGCLPGDSSSETARRHAVRRSLWLALLVMAPLLVLVLVGVWRSLSYRPV